jgi:hypothetical protein
MSVSSPSLPAHHLADEKTSISLCFCGIGRCISQTAVLTVVHCEHLCGILNSSTLGVTVVCVCVCVCCAHASGGETRPVFYWHSGRLPRPESSDDRLSPILGLSPLFKWTPTHHASSRVNKLPSLGAFWVVTLCVCVCVCVVSKPFLMIRNDSSKLASISWLSS